MLGTDTAIDLETSSVKIYLDGKGIILSRPSIVVHERDTDNTVTIGHEAYAMVGRTPSKIAVMHPLCDGVISDFASAQYVIQRYLKKIDGSRVVILRVVVSVPYGITKVKRCAVVDVISALGMRKICLIEKPVTAAMGTGVDISAPHSCFMVDIGNGTIGMGMISFSGAAIVQSIKMAGDAFDEAIIKVVRRKYDLLIGTRMAEETKMTIGCMYPRREIVTHRVKGCNIFTGLPQQTDINCDEALEAFPESAVQVIRTTQGVLEKTPPELMDDINTDGITLTGSSALFYGFDTLTSKRAKMKVFVPETPENYMAVGAGKATSFISDMENKNYGMLNPLNAAY